jgi:hypothetical protein
MPDPTLMWGWLPLGYLLSVLVEMPVLVVGLSGRHSFRRRVFAGLWLTACTYPVVILVLPTLVDPIEGRWLYLLIAETFAPVAECALFWTAFGERDEWGKPAMWRDFAVITLANLLSFAVGEVLHHFDVFAPMFGE